MHCQLKATYMVLEAKLVSSCFSCPSRARPLFSRLLHSVGVSVYTLQNVELGDTWSLKTAKTQESESCASCISEKQALIILCNN